MSNKPDDVTPPKAKAPPKVDQQVVNRVEQMQALLEAMSPAERARAEALGIRVPEGDISGAMDGRYKWGIRCTECNKIGLYLVGDQWKNPNAPDGFDREPPAWPHTRIVWTQNLPTDQINRNSPKCQHCGAQVVINSDGSFNRERNRIVQVRKFEETRDKASDRATIKALEKEWAKGTGGEDGLPSSYAMPDRPISEVIKDQGRLQELEHVAEVTGLNQATATAGGLAKAL